jgi:hypothetical protein
MFLKRAYFQSLIREIADKKTAYNEVRLYLPSDGTNPSLIAVGDKVVDDVGVVAVLLCVDMLLEKQLQYILAPTDAVGPR